MSNGWVIMNDNSNFPNFNKLEERVANQNFILYKDKQGQIQRLDRGGNPYMDDGTTSVYRLMLEHGQRYAWGHTNGRWYRYVKKPKKHCAARFELKEKHLPDYIKLYKMLLE